MTLRLECKDHKVAAEVFIMPTAIEPGLLDDAIARLKGSLLTHLREAHPDEAKNLGLMEGQQQ